MKIEELIEQKKYESIFKLMTEKSKSDIDKYYSEYNGDRDIRDTQVGKRKNKTTKEGEVNVNKIQFSFQKKIVQNASAFLFGEPVHIQRDETQEESENETDDEVDNVILQKNRIRLDSKLLKFAETVKSETEGALLFRIKKGEEGKPDSLKCNILDHEFGKLMPLFDTFGDMLSFGVQVKELDEDDEEIEVLYMYFKTTTLVFKVENETDLIPLLDRSGVHGFDRIPIVYASQKDTEWHQVETMIDRFELHVSKFGDTNDYFGSPKFKAVGKIDNVPTKDDTGQVYMMDVIETDQGQIVMSDLDVISWDQSPESVKLEIDMLRDMIYDMTNTTNITMETVKGIGNLSGTAIRLLFLNPYIKSKYDFNIFGPVVERCINIIKSFLVSSKIEDESIFDQEYKINFQSIIPDDVLELITMLTASTGGKPILSQETALENNPFVSNSVKEKMRIDNESSNDMGETFNII